METASLVFGVIPFCIKAGKTLHNLVSAYNDAPEDIKSLATEIKTFHDVLEMLGTNARDDNTIMNPAVEVVVKECDVTIKDLIQLLKKVSGKITKFENAGLEKKYRKFNCSMKLTSKAVIIRARLLRHKQTLNAALAFETLDRTMETLTVSETILTKISGVEVSTTDISAKLDRNESVTEDIQRGIQDISSQLTRFESAVTIISKPVTHLPPATVSDSSPDATKTITLTVTRTDS